MKSRSHQYCQQKATQCLVSEDLGVTENKESLATCGSNKLRAREEVVETWLYI